MSRGAGKGAFPWAICLPASRRPTAARAPRSASRPGGSRSPPPPAPAPGAAPQRARAQPPPPPREEPGWSWSTSAISCFQCLALCETELSEWSTRCCVRCDPSASAFSCIVTPS
nr:neural Wiskott-Aldrich syndrome protein-like [Aotus nancymaae]